MSSPTRLLIGPSSPINAWPVNPPVRLLSCGPQPGPQALRLARSLRCGLPGSLPTTLGGLFWSTASPSQRLSVSLGGVVGGPMLDSDRSPPHESVEEDPSLPEAFTCLSASPLRLLVGNEPIKSVEPDQRLVLSFRGAGEPMLDSDPFPPLMHVNEVSSLPEDITGLSATGLFAFPIRLLLGSESSEPAEVDSLIPEASIGRCAPPPRLLVDTGGSKPDSGPPLPQEPVEEVPSLPEDFAGLSVGPLIDIKGVHVALGALDNMSERPSPRAIGLVTLGITGSAPAPIVDLARFDYGNADASLPYCGTSTPLRPRDTSVPCRSSSRLLKKQADSTLCRAMRRKATLLEGATSSPGTKARNLTRQRIKSKSLLCGVNLSDAEASELCSFIRVGA